VANLLGCWVLFGSIRLLLTLIVGAGLAGVSPHAYRHTFASRRALAGGDLPTIQRLRRWASVSLVPRYANLGKTRRAELTGKDPGNSPAILTTPAENEPRGSGLEIAMTT